MSSGMKSLLFVFEYSIFLLIYPDSVIAVREDDLRRVTAILKHKNPSNGYTFLVHWNTMAI